MSKTRLIRLDQAMCCSRLKPVGVGWVQAQRMRRKGDLLVAADSSGGPVDIGPDPLTGKRREERKGGFRTAKEAQSALAQVVAAVSTGEHRHDGRLTVGEWLTTWLDWRIENGLRASTALRYRAYVDAVLIPHLGRVRLGDLRPEHVERMISDLRKSGKGAITIQRIHAVL